MKNLQNASEAITLTLYTAMTLVGSLLLIYGVYQFALAILPVLGGAVRSF